MTEKLKVKKFQIKMAVYTFINTWLDIRGVVDSIELEANASFSTEGDSDILRSTMYEIFRQQQRDAVEIVASEPNSERAAMEFLRKLVGRLPEIANEIGHLYALSRPLWNKVVNLFLDVFLCAVQQKYTQRMNLIERTIRRGIDMTSDNAYLTIHVIKQRKRDFLNIDNI